MFDFTGGAAGVRMTMLAGAIALAGFSGTATAQAMPVAPAAAPAEGLELVQYGHPGDTMHHMYGHRRSSHHRYGMNYHPRHPGHAGLYDCGPGGHRTRLSRKACGGNDRFGHLYRY